MASGLLSVYTRETKSQRIHGPSMPITLATRTHGRSTTEQLSTIPVPASARSWLTRLLAGEVELPAFASAPPSTLPNSVSETAAIARALAAPELFVLEASDRAVREAALTALLRIAAERGERVLLLSPDPIAADRLVAALAEPRTIRVVRALADNENPHRSIPVVSRLISSQAGTGRADQMKREASLAVTTLEAKRARLERSTGVRARLEAIERERATLGERLASLESELQTEWDAKRAASLAPVDAELANLTSQLSAKRSTLETSARDRTPTQKKLGFFARFFGAGKPAPEPTVELPIGVDPELQELLDREAKVRAEREAVAAQLTAAADAERANDLVARRAAIETRLAELDVEAVRLDASVREFQPRLTTSDDTVENGAPSKLARSELERELAVARTRLQELTSAAPDLARRLLAETQVVVGTPGSLESDSVFKALKTALHPFDLLVLDHAEELTEPAFEHLSTLATRTILAGETTTPTAPRPQLNGHGHPTRPRSTAPSLFSRLARLLDHEPWRIEAGRLVLRLVHLSAEARQGLSREPVLDHPDVELGVSIGEGEPVLAEIAFPASTSIVEAKTFLVSQLGEVLLRTCGERTWHRSEERLTASWPMEEANSGEWINLEEGVCEKVAGAGTAAFTVAVSFELAAGWTESAAEEWLARHTTSASASRYANLGR